MIDFVKLHLMLTALPPIVSGMAMVVLAAGMVWNSRDLKRFALLLMAAVPLLIVPVYVSGKEAVVVVGNLSGVPLDLIGEHEDSVFWTFATATFGGVVALFGFIASRANRRIARWYMAAAILVSLGTDALIFRTAYLGGRIRHSEIRRVAPPEAEAGATEASARSDRRGPPGLTR